MLTDINNHLPSLNQEIQSASHHIRIALEDDGISAISLTDEVLRAFQVAFQAAKDMTRVSKEIESIKKDIELTRNDIEKEKIALTKKKDNAIANAIDSRFLQQKSDLEKDFSKKSIAWGKLEKIWQSGISQLREKV